MQNNIKYIFWIFIYILTKSSATQYSLFDTPCLIGNKVISR